jgi:hypothetical protein
MPVNATVSAKVDQMPTMPPMTPSLMPFSLRNAMVLPSSSTGAAMVARPKMRDAVGLMAPDRSMCMVAPLVDAYGCQPRRHQTGRPAGLARQSVVWLAVTRQFGWIRYRQAPTASILVGCSSATRRGGGR